jgi:valyl-tRNA synthetase
LVILPALIHAPDLAQVSPCKAKKATFAVQIPQQMESNSKYSPEGIESKWYNYWMDHRFFESRPDAREPFTILIPPPNVTGVLHMGHMLNNTIQDVLIRRARMQGKNACWVPGTDHASIATEAKVVALIREKGMSKQQVGREAFLEYAFEWKEKYGGIILDQLKRLGASCDWSRTRFTMEPSLSRAVTKVFVDLYKKGKVYRGLRMTNWDPVARTVLSTEEVIYKEEQSQLFYLRYRLADDPSRWITIATQRPETIMADVAIAVHPEDDRFSNLVGKSVLIPLIQRPIPIIADTYVDREFGTGALKITPAHDQNDHEVGQRHNLPVIDILDEHGRLNEEAQILVGEDRFDARKKIKKMLEEAEAIEKTEFYKTNIGRSERTDAVVEPRLTLQWFLDMKAFAKTALEAVQGGDVRFFPEHFINMYQSWLREENVRDWCISRQLWWGQRIPAWFYLDSEGKEQVVVAETAEEALQEAQRLAGRPIQMGELCQDEDVVDTWFSSWLWPMSVFDAFDDPEEFRYYYPTNVLVTGWDIMFFWVARMIMAGYEWSPALGADPAKGFQPFKDVFFTGMVRDNKRRKMSKSLGNSPEALTLIDTYGADGVRFGMLASASAGNDIVFDAPFDASTGQVLNESKLCEQGRNFCNKLWNVNRAIQSWETDPAAEQSEAAALAVQWYEERLIQTAGMLEQHFEQYRLSDALMEVYKLIWDDFCSWYIELIKPTYGKGIDAATRSAVLLQFERSLEMLHPFMPFITEELWQNLGSRSEGQSICLSPYPTGEAKGNPEIIAQMEKARELVTQVRALKNQYKYGQRDAVELSVHMTDPGFFTRFEPLLKAMAHLSALSSVKEKPANTAVFLSGRDECFFPMGEAADADQERQKMQEELVYQEGFLKSVMAKLNNEGFVARAPEKVIEMERKKQADAEARIAILKQNLGL